MPVIGIMLLLFGILIIAVPELVGILIGIFFVLIGGNILLVYFVFNKGKKDFIKFGNYEIYRNKK